MPADALTVSIADGVRAERERQGLSAAALAQRSGVSRAMIGKVERGEAQPSAALLARLADAFGLTLSQMIAAAEVSSDAGRRLARRAEQPLWSDPRTGYTRRALSPVAGGALELAEIVLPPRAAVAYGAGEYPDRPQQILVLDGTLCVEEAGVAHTLQAGDCLALGPAGARRYVNPSPQPARYVVALARR